MPVIEKFEWVKGKEPKAQPTKVTAHWSVKHSDGGQTLLQIDTRGSDAREKPDKQSQTVQLNETSARQLWSILGKEFGFSK